MSHYADYLKERTMDQIIETEDGFATYRFLDQGQVYLVDLFVSPEKRKLGIARALANAVAMIAKEHGCKSLLMTIVPSTKGCTVSLKAALAYGMTLQGSSNNCIVLRKDI